MASCAVVKTMPDDEAEMGAEWNPTVARRNAEHAEMESGFLLSLSAIALAKVDEFQLFPSRALREARGKGDSA